MKEYRVRMTVRWKHHHGLSDPYSLTVLAADQAEATEKAGDVVMQTANGWSLIDCTEVMTKPDRVYVAAPSELRDAAIEVMTQLEARGHEVTSSWLKEDSFVENDEWARRDLKDVGDADLLLAVNPEEFRRSGTGGRHVEFGYALALKKQIVVLGVRTHIFHRLSHVRVIEKLEDL